ncbi:hypothetical protein Cgig2_032970 [Carnegiea gigantea]|uniref:RNase H type-1 domain-containing protein n=1 Tax=Carnegiea gigantea TaxID=171969 RepID=A0A9Q1K1I6_9CARY|nr:hypothetical protein Cgig2_032970 [Carnegiea gigantea]
MVWTLDVPPRVRLFGWKVGVGALATKNNIARRIPSFGMSCEIYGALEDFDVHTLFECPLATEIWRESEFDEQLWRSSPFSVMDRLILAKRVLDRDRLGEFVAVIWEIWNERNCFIFGHSGGGMGKWLAPWAVSFVRHFRDFNTRNTQLKPPITGAFKLNFEAGKVGEGCRGCGFVIRNNLGDVVLAGVKQGPGFLDLELEETRACYFAMSIAAAHGFRSLMVEGDSQALINKLCKKEVPNN